MLGFSASKRPVQKDLRPFFNDDDELSNNNSSPTQLFSHPDWDKLQSILPPHPINNRALEQQPVIYGVAHGRNPGLYISNEAVKQQVLGYQDAIWGIF